MKVLKINEKTTPGTATTATVEVGGKVQELAVAEGGEAAYRHFTIYGLAVRYRTGSKVWPGTAIYWPATGHINNVLGTQDHRSGRGASLQIVGFWSDVQDQYRSEHSSVTGGSQR
jgi:hypothetical protein